jgi:hypothetical protein
VSGLILDHKGHAAARTPQDVDHPVCVGERRAVVLAAVEDEHWGADERFDALRLREARVCLTFESKGTWRAEDDTRVGHTG